MSILSRSNNIELASPPDFYPHYQDDAILAFSSDSKEYHFIIMTSPLKLFLGNRGGIAAISIMFEQKIGYSSISPHWHCLAKG
jgi:hypothetical protein